MTQALPTRTKTRRAITPRKEQGDLLPASTPTLDEEIDRLWQETIQAEQFLENAGSAFLMTRFALGEKLVQKKALAQWGQWYPWLEEHGIDRQKAQRAMRLYAKYREDPSALTHIRSLADALGWTIQQVEGSDDPENEADDRPYSDEQPIVHKRDLADSLEEARERFPDRRERKSSTLPTGAAMERERAEGRTDGERVESKVKDDGTTAEEESGPCTVIAAGTPAEPAPAAPPLPAKKFNCVLLDPPWHYELRVQDDSHRNRIPYPSMTVEEIAMLPIVKMAGDATVMWMWTTNNHMPDACFLLQGWGFTLKTIITWVKTTNDGEKVRMGTGHWLRNATEHCLLAVRGDVSSFAHLETLTNETTVLFAPRREHSRKPVEMYELIEKLCPGGEKVELFARNTRQGWVSWGNEVEKYDATS